MPREMISRRESGPRCGGTHLPVDAINDIVLGPDLVTHVDSHIPQVLYHAADLL